jgi:hypothetical protein
VRISTEKVMKRGKEIESVELEAPAAPALAADPITPRIGQA